jgi:dCTP deaminase
VSQLFTGGMLTAQEIREQMKLGNIRIRGFNPKCLNPNSYNVTLNEKLLKYTKFPLDPKSDNPTEEVIIPPEGLIVNPGDFYLGTTNEFIDTLKHVPCISGRSSIGRLSTAIHQTAGFGDIGFCGRWTLEMFVLVPTIWYPNMEIGQVYWFEPCGAIEDFYKGKYQYSSDVEASKMFKDF